MLIRRVTRRILDKDNKLHVTAKPDVFTLTVAAIGVVFGDIGTSPLYTMKEAFSGSHPVAANHDNVLGVLSLVFWALIIVVTLKYVVFMMRADNRGEGGIMALLALVLRATAAVPAAAGS